MKENPLLKLEALGQSIWMDFIRRGMISSGQLKQLIEEDVTSNPSIFEKAIAALHHRAKCNGFAVQGKYSEQMERANPII